MEKFVIVTPDLDYSCSCAWGWPDMVYGPFKSERAAYQYAQKVLKLTLNWEYRVVNLTKPEKRK